MTRALPAAAAIVATVVVPGSSMSLRWTQLAPMPGAVDVAGPRADGRFVVAASQRGLFLMRKNGSTTPFARGPGGYAAPGGEPYIALTPAKRVRGAGCSFKREDIYALEPTSTPGVIKITRSGQASRFVELPSGSFPSTIAYDTVGRFGRRLLVTTTASGKSTLYAIDCRARVRAVASALPLVEGGSAVAPRTFGRFGGKLIAADEHTGRIYAFDAKGRVTTVARPNLPAGGDIGVESLGFVPPKFTRHGVAFLADLGAPGSPTAGTDSVLHLRGAPIRTGDLVVATEASGVTIRIRCKRTCTVRRIARALDATHGEGHVAFAR